MSPPAPIQLEPPDSWPHKVLHRRVREAISALPIFFHTDTVISGIMATDIYTLNQVLGAAIEQQVVETLNSMRRVWDPDEQYPLFRFVRQSQTFPDVLLRRLQPEPETIMGIELKGWYLLAKEREPSFRYTVTPRVCNSQDLLVVVPWALSNVISGSPKVFDPYVASARYAAEYRNYYWEHVRVTQSDARIHLATACSPYPTKSDAICDRPYSDSGSNFGRLARCGVMDEYMAQARSQPLCGIEAQHWLAFFKLFQDRPNSPGLLNEIERLASRVSRQVSSTGGQILPQVRSILDALRGILDAS